jgi:hypothetical protein
VHLVGFCYKNIHDARSSECQQCLREVTHLILMFLLTKYGPFDVVLHNDAVYKNVTMTLKEDLMRRYLCHVK